MISLLTTEQELRRYNEWILTHPEGSLWQSLERKQYLEACGKKVLIYVCEDESTIAASALVSIDRTIGGYSSWEIPRGPLWNGKLPDEFLERIVDDAKKDRCLAAYFSPVIGLPATHSPLRASSRHIHAQATRILDLTRTEEQLLAEMHPKGRYNINVAKKHGIEIRKGAISDIDSFYGLLQGTGTRDAFRISQKSHYTRFLSELKGSFIMMAEHQGKAVAGLMGVIWNGTGIYYYGASSYEHRHLMAPYLLQWEAMKYCKQEGCTKYDLLGISPDNAAANDPWAGITDFKRKFGGTVVTYPPEQMMVMRPFIKSAIEWKRRIVG